MSTQLYYVFKTYWTRWECVLLLIVFGLMLMFSYTSSEGRNAFLVPIAPALISPAKEIQGNSRELVIPTVKREARRIRSVNLAVIEDTPLPQLQSLPNLQRLSLKTVSLSQDQAEQVLTLPKLRSLQLDVREIPDGFLRSLGTQLTQLKLPAFLLNQHAAELSSLTKLQLLRIDQEELDKDTLEAIATIPHLRTLVIQQEPTEVPLRPLQNQNSKGFLGDLSLHEEYFLAMMQHPTLREVYADWAPALLSNSQFLSRVHAYPFRSVIVRNPSLPLAAIAVGIVSIIVLTQLAAHFLNPAATVIPRYTTPHGVVAGGVLTAAVLLTWTLTGQKLFSSASLFTILLAIPCWLTAIISLSSIPQEYQRLSKTADVLRIVLLFFTFTPPIFSSFCPPWITGTLDWYLRGHYPAVSWMTLLIQVGILTIALCNARKIGRMINLAHPEWNGTSLFNWRSQQESTLKGRNSNWQLKGVDAKLAHLQFHDGNFWKQVRLLQLGNPYRPVQFVGFMAIASVVGVLIGAPSQKLPWLESLLSDFEVPEIDLMPILNIVLFQFGMIAFWMPALFWYQRRQSLPMEFCRPIERTDFARQLFCALAIDQGLALIPIAGIVLGILLLSDVPSDRNYLLIASPFLLATAICLYAITTTLFAIRRTWVILGLGILCFFFLIATMGGTIGYLISSDGKQYLSEIDAAKIVTCYTAALGIAMVGIVTTWILFRMTRHREWG